MDCEKFDEHVIDALYGELDELTAAAMNRHADGCARCAGVISGLRSAREAAAMPLEEPSAELETRILEAERSAQKGAPWPRKLMRAAAWAGSHAMRPQLAMAALFMLVVGSSMLLLRARPGTVGAPVQVTEHGEPSPAAPAATAAVPESQSKGRAGKAEASEGKDGEARSLTTDRSDRDKEKAAPPAALDEAAPAPAAANGEVMVAPGAPAASAATKNEADAQLALAQARNARYKNGCADAIGRYNDVTKRFPASHEAEVAAREAGECQESGGKAPVGGAKPAPRDDAGASKPEATSSPTRAPN